MARYLYDMVIEKPWKAYINVDFQIKQSNGRAHWDQLYIFVVTFTPIYIKTK